MNRQILVVVALLLVFVAMVQSREMTINIKAEDSSIVPWVAASRLPVKRLVKGYCREEGHFCHPNTVQLFSRWGPGRRRLCYDRDATLSEAGIKDRPTVWIELWSTDEC